MSEEVGVVKGVEPDFDKINVGDEFSFVKGPITREGIQAYGKASGDINPIHMNEKAAIRAGLGDVIAHGLYNMAHVNQMLADWAGEKGMVRKLDVEFRGMVRIGDMLTCKGKITRKYEEDGKKCVDLDVWQESKTLVSKSSATIPKKAIEGMETEYTEAVSKGFLREKDVLRDDFVIEKSGRYEEEGKGCIDFNMYRIERTIIGTATVILP
jgi:acyl dehydratase